MKVTDSQCLGYKAVGDGKPFLIDEDAYSIVEYIFQAYHTGRDMTGIARSVKTPWDTVLKVGNRVEKHLQNPYPTSRRGLEMESPFKDPTKPGRLSFPRI